MGYEVSIVNQLDQDIAKLTSRGFNIQPCTEKDQVTYLRAHSSLFQKGYLRGFVSKLALNHVRGAERLLRRIDLHLYVDWLVEKAGMPDIVHAHSPAQTAFEAAFVAQCLKVPMVYEVRGFWPLSHAAENDKHVDIMKAILPDIEIIKKTTHVVAICKGIADMLVRGGVRANKISIIPNGVDSSLFHPRPCDNELAKKLRINGRIIYGYATNIRRLEGIQTIIEAWPIVTREIPNALFLVLGDGRYLSMLKDLVREHNVSDSFLFLGRVPHEEILSYYSLLNAFVVPRIPEPVCQIVTPLKPLEAMSMGIPVIASDLPALREMVQNEETGILFKADDPKALAEACIKVGKNVLLRGKISSQAKEWVTKERDWTVLTLLYRQLYNYALD